MLWLWSIWVGTTWACRGPPAGTCGSYIWLCNRSLLNFLIYAENLIFFLISVPFLMLWSIWVGITWACRGPPAGTCGTYIWLCNRSLLNFLRYAENFIFFLISVSFIILWSIWVGITWACRGPPAGTCGTYIWLCNQTLLNFLIYAENLIFFLISVSFLMLWSIWVGITWACRGPPVGTYGTYI